MNRPLTVNRMCLKLRRISLGMSPESLAETSGLSRQTILDLESGRADNPRLSTLNALALALGYEDFTAVLTGGA